METEVTQCAVELGWVDEYEVRLVTVNLEVIGIVITGEKFEIGLKIILNVVLIIEGNDGRAIIHKINSCMVNTFEVVRGFFSDILI